MPNSPIYFAASVQGPLASPQARDAVVAWLDDSKKAIAQEAVDQLRAYVMDKTGRGTGHYQSEIQTTTLRYNDILVRDPVVYGPWLEGTSKRNRDTRFKGYHLWRLTRQRVQERAPQIAEDRLKVYASAIGVNVL